MKIDFGNYDEYDNEGLTPEQEIELLKQYNKNLLDLIKELEWVEVNAGIKVCPCCLNAAFKGHRFHCKLLKALQ